MAGGLNDLELETETLDEVCLSPLPAARRRPVKPTQGELDAPPARGARRLGSGVALGVTLVLALITWVSLRVDTPPKARAAPDLVSTPPAAADIPEVVTPVAVSYGRPHPSSHAAQHAHHRHAHNHTHNHTRPHVSPVVEALPAAPVEPPLLDLLSAPLDLEVSDTAATEMQEVQSVADAAATLISTPLEGSETATTEEVQSTVADAAATALVDAMAALKEAQAAVAAAEEPIDIQSVSESERRLQEMSIDGEEEVQAPTPREPEDEEPIQAPTPREPEDEEPEIVTPAITRRRLRGGGGASWWARLLRRLAEATY